MWSTSNSDINSIVTRDKSSVIVRNVGIIIIRNIVTTRNGNCGLWLMVDRIQEKVNTIQ